MFITGLGTAVPVTRYRQSDCLDVLVKSRDFARLNLRSRAILKKVLTGNNGISTRHLALDPLDEAFDLRPDALHARFLRHAPDLATRAAEEALANAGIDAKEIDALIISTCTGYLCPGLTSHVGERLNLPRHVLALDLVGQGCGAAIPNLRTGESLLAAGRCQRVLSICVEVCSAAFYLDDDPGVLISACLFADGAGAAVLSADPPASDRRRVEWKDSISVLAPEARDLLRFEQKGGMLRNILSPAVPKLAARHAKEVFDALAVKADFKASRIKNWILHAGGRDVILAIREALLIEEKETCWSAGVLDEFGNLSSPFVYFVLKRALENQAAPGLWWMAAFGAGFSSHGTLLAVGPPAATASTRGL